MEHSGNSKPRFRLVELLLVVAIAVPCVMVALPALRRREDGPGRVICASNVRNIALGVTQYYFENDDWLPMACAGGREKGKHTYVHEISQYLGIEGDEWLEQPYWKAGAPEILTCPSERKDLGHNILSYGWNWKHLGGFPSDGEWWIRVKKSTVVRPGETSCLGESRPLNGGLKTTLWWGDRSDKGEYYFGRRHNEGANYMCLDGHVEYAKFDDLVKDWEGKKQIFSRD